MKYNNIVQKARRKYLNRVALSPEEQFILDRDFNGKDYIFYKENAGKDFLFGSRYSADQTFPRIEQAISQHTAYKKKLLIRYIGSAVAVLLISLFSFHLYKMFTIPQMEYVSTSYGERKDISLPDGTVIILNSLSSVSYPQGLKGDTRQVELKGEACFDVASEADRPFIVKANNLEIRVLGTKFNIEAYENEENIITSLFEGSVSIHVSDGVTRKLVPGDKAVYNKNSGKINTLYTDNIDNQIYWIKNILYFDNEPLADILKTLARERDVHFKLENPTTGNLRITARFAGNETMEDILSILSQSGDFSYNRQGNIYYIK